MEEYLVRMFFSDKYDTFEDVLDSIKPLCKIILLPIMPEKGFRVHLQGIGNVQVAGIVLGEGERKVQVDVILSHKFFGMGAFTERVLRDLTENMGFKPDNSLAIRQQFYKKHIDGQIH